MVEDFGRGMTCFYGGIDGGSVVANRMSRGDHSKMIANQLPVDGGVGSRKNIKEPSRSIR